MNDRTSLNTYLDQLKKIFVKNRDKREANALSRDVLSEMSADREVLYEIIKKHLLKSNSLNMQHYPAVVFDIEANPYFTLVANCWIPLPDRNTDISTNSIHHHGDMLLSTAAAFGPGYEHWLFSNPTPISESRNLFTTSLIERKLHSANNVDFVDSYTAHTLFYPPSLSITYAMWSSQNPTNWRDFVKRAPSLHKNAKALRRFGSRLGLAKLLQLKVISYFDFFPTSEGLYGLPDRIAFPLGPNADYLTNLFHIIQETGNESLFNLIKDEVVPSQAVTNTPLVERCLGSLRSGSPIEPRLSEVHHGVEHANFSSQSIEVAISASKKA